MQELEKILEEIEKGTHTFELLGRDVDFVAIDWVRDVIRKYMNDDNEIMEQCPYCENEAALHWDVEKDGHQVFCPNCGKPMMLCSMCDAKDGAVCDWKEGEGCKHSDERYRDYFRKHMNDDWNSVEKYELPKEEGIYDLTVINGRGEYVSVRWQFLSGTHLSGTQHYVDGVHYWADNYRGDPINEFLSERVIAWRKKPEPYRPKNESLMLENGKLNVKGVKQIAEITICGVLHISVNECDGHTDFIVPTPEQRKNLKEMLCIDVKVFDEERSDNHDRE